MMHCLPLGFLSGFLEVRVEEVGAFTSSLLLVCVLWF